MERFTAEKIGCSVTLAVVAIGLLGCVPVTAEAYTTPFGITYLNGSEHNEQIVAHEQQHWEDYQEDPLFFLKYTFVDGYACEAEKKANEAAHILPVDNHPACRN